MDDPISALDTQTRKKIFDDVFQGILKDKTRILVTHAVDFVHLADKIVIMNDGKIVAQGSYKELVDHPYMIQIQDIHETNRDELSNAKEEPLPYMRRQSNGPAQVSLSDDDTHSSDEVKQEAPVLTDSEIMAKLEVFAGSKLGLDEETEKVVGKLLMNEKDEEINANSTTFFKLYTMVGGAFSIVFFVMQNIFFRVLEVY